MINTVGYAAPSHDEPLAPYHFKRRSLKEHDVLIDIQYCGVCHSDIHSVREDWGQGLFPMVPGHEIVGIVKEVGKHVTLFKEGDSVGVGCFIDSCRQCENCKAAEEQFCSEGATYTYNSRDKEGTVTQGGYSNNIVVDENYVLKIPTNLPLDRTAPLLCAGITLYSPLKHWRAGPGKHIGIVGLGGLGHIGVKLAHAFGAEVSVFSHSPEKEKDALQLKANHFYSTQDATVFNKLANKFDLIINTVSAPIDWNPYLKLLKRNGTMVVVGLPPENIPINPFSLISGRHSLAGSLIGGIKETQEMLNFCGRHNITADIERIPIQKINEAYERVIQSDVHYRFVIDLASLDND